MGLITVLVVDDHEAVRQGLCKLLELEEGIQVVGEAKDGEEAVSKAKSLLPDVILMDLKMPKKDGLEATRQIKEANPETKVIILSVYDEAYFRSQAKRADASAYLVKDLPIEHLIETIKDVHGDSHPLPS